MTNESKRNELILAASQYHKLAQQKKDIERQMKTLKVRIMENLPGPDTYQVDNLVVRWQKKTSSRIDPKLVKELVPDSVVEACTKETSSDYLSISEVKGLY